MRLVFGVLYFIVGGVLTKVFSESLLLLLFFNNTDVFCCWPAAVSFVMMKHGYLKEPNVIIIMVLSMYGLNIEIGRSSSLLYHR